MPDTSLPNENVLPLPSKRKLSRKGLVIVLLVALGSYLFYAGISRPPQPPGWIAGNMSLLPDPIDDFIKEDWGHTFMIRSPGNRKSSWPIQALTHEAIDWIRSNRKLKELSLERIDLDQADLDWLNTLPNLKDFTFEGIHLDDEHLKGIGGAASLKTIWLTNAKTNQHQDAATASTRPAPSISQEGIKHLASLPNLEYLYIEQFPIGDGAFADIGGMPNLRHINLQHCALSGALFQHITISSGFGSINFSNNPIEDESLEHLTHLKQLHALTLNETPITDLALKHIGELRGNLYTLEIVGTNITDSGLLHLLQLKNLFHLNLSDTSITDTGLAHIAKLSKLEYLYLRNTKITGAGLLTLGKLPKLHTVRLSVDFGKKYPQAVNEFKKTHQVLFL